MAESLFLVVIFCSVAIFFTHGQEQRQRFHEQKCSNLYGDPGHCLNIYRCPPLLEAVKFQPPPLAMLRYLHSQCDVQFEGLSPVVCCFDDNSDAGKAGVNPQPIAPPARPINSRLSPKNNGDLRLHPNTRLLPLEICGRSENSKIFGGTATDLDEFPWTALLEHRSPNGRRHFGCGGVLINERYVLTAAHCTTKELKGISTLIGVHLGEHDTSTALDCEENPTGGQTCADPPRNFQVETELVHPQYNKISNFHDIALLRLDRSATPFTAYITPICMPIDQESMSKTYVGSNLIVAGWGITESGQGSKVKLKVNVPVVDFATCQRKFATRNIRLWPGELCAGGVAGRDSCRGDSGGALMSVASGVSDGTPRYHVTGVVSFGVRGGCGQPGWPAVYTRVAAYSGWILDQLRP